LLENGGYVCSYVVNFDYNLKVINSNGASLNKIKWISDRMTSYRLVNGKTRVGEVNWVILRDN
jgi:hypothetical protein